MIGAVGSFAGKVVNTIKEQVQKPVPAKQTVSSAQDYLSQCTTKNGKKATVTKTFTGYALGDGRRTVM